MPKPIKHRELVRRFRLLGWQGPWQKGKHPFLVKDGRRLTIPNPHEGDIDWTNIQGSGTGTVTKLGVVQGTATISVSAAQLALPQHHVFK